MKEIRPFFFATLWLLCICAASPAQVSPPSQILQDLRSFRELGSVLFIAAHPDDENTQLITYLARGRNYRTAYLSVTRGDGGQNLLGSEFSEQLGVIRTQELLAARRLDGGRQFFTRAIDFGYSKHVAETLRIWDRQQVLGDVVRVMRVFRPDVVIVRFNPDTDNTHGHHTASAVLGREAFALAGDPTAFPEQLTELSVWKPKRVVLNGGGFGRGGGGAGGGVQMQIGGNDPISEESFGSIASRSRAMHKTQGFDRGGRGGGARGGGGNPSESFTLLGGEPMTQDILDGVDTSWGRFNGGAPIGPLIEQVITAFKAEDPSASVPALLEVKRRLAALSADPVGTEKQLQLDRIIQACLGLSVETVLPDAEVVPGETMNLRHTASLRSSIPVKWMAVRYPGAGRDVSEPIELRPNQTTTRQISQVLPANTLLTQPYWLREDPAPGIYRVNDPSLISRPENPSSFPIEHLFEVGGQTIVIPDEPMQVRTDPSKGESRRRLDVIPSASLHFLSEVSVFSPGGGPARPVELEILAWRSNVRGTVQLDVPSGWTVTPVSTEFALAQPGQSAHMKFDVHAARQPTQAKIGAHITINGAKFDTDRIDIRYDHIPPQLLQPHAQVKAVATDLATRGSKIGYLQGAGDSVSECLDQMGYAVTQLTASDLTSDRLKGYDAVVLGIRAFETRADLAAQVTNLLAYVEAGGNLIIQYNRSDVDPANRGKFGEFVLQQSQQRITDETAPPTFLAPDHPVLNTPNKITAADFDGWVQERGIHFPGQWDKRFTPIIGFSDPGEQPLNGGLLIAKHGKGYLVYTGLVFFRELPEGVPGAYRLFANLVSLGK